MEGITMNTDLQTQLTELKTELRAIIACEGVTDGPWKRTGPDFKGGKDYIKVRGTKLGGRWSIVDVPFIYDDVQSDRKEAENIAAFIARSRTITPLMAEILLSQVEFLQRVFELATDKNIYQPIEQQLTSILAKWKGAKV